MAVSISTLDLQTAWRRVKWDLDHRVFATYAFQEDICDSVSDTWFERLRQADATTSYSAHPCEICEVPKKGFHIRPGSRLDLDDHLVYCALVQEMYPAIRDHLMTWGSPKDHAYLLQGIEDVPWFQQPPFRGWSRFNGVSIQKIDAGKNVVLFGDISGFYENIDLGKLRDVLRGIGVSEDHLQTMQTHLWKWSQPRGRGIPQGHSPSDLLAKVYLDSVDRRLEREGFDHLRYVDDTRVFCATVLEAKKALMRLSALLRDVGLNLESSKTEIRLGDEAKAIILGKIPSIEGLQEDLVEAIRQEGFNNPYFSADQLDSLPAIQQDVAREVLEQAFQDHFLVPDAQFDKSLLHYVLSRLGRLGSNVAIEYAFGLLTERPDETESALHYLANFAADVAVSDRIVAFARSADAIYDHQCYEIVRWLRRCRVGTNGSLQLGRVLVADRSKPFWLRSHAFALLGEFGDNADMDTIEALYPHAANELERAIVLSSLRRMPTARRNAVYARFAGDGFLPSAAVGLARREVRE